MTRRELRERYKKKYHTDLNSYENAGRYTRWLEDQLLDKGLATSEGEVANIVEEVLRQVGNQLWIDHYKADEEEYGHRGLMFGYDENGIPNSVELEINGRSHSSIGIDTKAIVHLKGKTAEESGVHPVLLLASYCGDDNSGCTDTHPCTECLQMCNIAFVKNTAIDLKNIVGGFEYSKHIAAGLDKEGGEG